MNLRLIGAFIVISACGGFGFLLARNYKNQERALFQFQRALSYISCDLAYKSAILPELCTEAAGLVNGSVQKVFLLLAQQLQSGDCPDASSAMEQALKTVANVAPNLQRLLLQLGQCLGRFDLDGQLKELDAVSVECRKILDEMRMNRTNRIRNYQTLGLCAGAALAILLV